MKKKNFIIVLSLILGLLFSACTKDVSKIPGNTTTVSQKLSHQQKQNPIRINPNGGDEQSQSKLPNPVTPLLDDPNAPGQYYCYYGDIKFVFSSFVYPIGAFAEGDPISACC